MINEQTWQTAGEQVQQWPRVLLLTHVRPDGDALGAMLGLGRVLTARGQAPTAFVSDQIPTRYDFLTEATPVAAWPSDPAEIDALGSKFDGIVIVDTCSWRQLESFEPFLRTSTLPRIVVDHHATRDDLAGADGPVTYLIDDTAASASGLVHAWSQAMDWPLDEGARDALFTGMATDTGWFRFSNTDGNTLRAAARLVEAGTRPDLLYARLYESWSPARVKLKGLVLNTLEYHFDQRLALMTLTDTMLSEADATRDDADELVNLPQEAGRVAVTVMLTPQDNGLVRVNLRSKAPAVCGTDVDVAAIARDLGGGGHRRAAGVRIPGTLEDARQRILTALADIFS